MTVKLVFGCDMILPTKHTLYWKLIRQQNQTQINKDNMRENRNQVDHDYNIGVKVILNDHAENKYETLQRTHL